MTRPHTLRAALVAASVVLLLSSCTAIAAGAEAEPTTVASASSSSTPAPAEPVTAVVPVDAAPFATQELGDGVVFTSPSGDLRCGIVTSDVEYLWGCRIEEKEWEFPSDDPADYCYDAQVPCGWGIEATGDGETHPRKRGDVAFESEYRVDTPVLEHGTSIEYGGITCVSEPEGMTCENSASGHGFTISASRNDLW
ncbi:DUF6636 domain-containing protein [Agromyces albus]|uniref:DUF3558 domain-containing protein n=1 Tax=Agromyces albus TaxID=205332 RepID=A0A4Q2KNS6_9MICO|nr:DUF6636 domain-containing protein [Agromyces albus]RXZ67008.1 hypothetical protein ESP51_19660 [Agromyces albus]